MGLTVAESIPPMMQAISIAQPGGPSVLREIDVPVPRPSPSEVLIRVAAAGVNRPDVLQRLGRYPVPPGASPLPGLEVSGTVVATGSEVSVALDAAERLASESISARVVSMPSWDRFEKFRAMNSAAADAILPRSLPTVSVEAGATMGWHKYADECIGIDRFGASAPGATALVNLGIEAGNVVSTVRRLLGRGN